MPSKSDVRQSRTNTCNRSVCSATGTKQKILYQVLCSWKMLIRICHFSYLSNVREMWLFKLQLDLGVFLSHVHSEYGFRIFACVHKILPSTVFFHCKLFCSLSVLLLWKTLFWHLDVLHNQVLISVHRWVVWLCYREKCVSRCLHLMYLWWRLGVQDRGDGRKSELPAVFFSAMEGINLLTYSMEQSPSWEANQ